MERLAESKENASLKSAAKAEDTRAVAADTAHPRRLYVGNLSYAAREIDLIRAFGEFGRLATVDIVFHRKGPEAGRPRGFAFVEFEEGADARKAVKALNDTRFLGRSIVVRACEPDELRDLGAKSTGPAATGATSSGATGGAGAGAGGGRAPKRAQLDAIDAKIASLRAKLQKKSH